MRKQSISDNHALYNPRVALVLFLAHIHFQIFIRKRIKNDRSLRPARIPRIIGNNGHLRCIQLFHRDRKEQQIMHIVRNWPENARPDCFA